MPARDELLPVSTGGSCLFCGTRDWEWVYLLLREPEWVKQLDWTIGWDVVMCDACRGHYDRGEDEVLVRKLVEQRDREDFDEAQAQLLAKVVRERQSEPPIPRRDAIVPGVAELMSEGFTPIEDLTGAESVALVWPEEHRRSVPEVRAWMLEHKELQGRLWAVRSPWPGIPLKDVFRCLWSVVDRYRDGDARQRAAAEVLSWDEPRARSQLAAARAQRDPD